MTWRDSCQHNLYNDKYVSLTIYACCVILSTLNIGADEPVMSESGDKVQSGLQQHLQEERERLQQDIELLRQQVEAKEWRLTHVIALLDGSAPAPGTAPAQKRRRSPGTSTATWQLLEMAVEVLRERNGEPMHYRDLADELVRRGAIIHGKDPASGLVSRMTQDDARRDEEERRFVRPTSKGFYALREDYPNARNVGAKRRRRNASD